MVANAQATFWSEGSIAARTSLYVHHYSYEPDHNDEARMLNVEWIAASGYTPRWLDRGFLGSPKTRWLAGAAYFRNSFNQDSGYAYGGLRHDVLRRNQATVYLKLTGGVLYGYKGEFQDKIPFNSSAGFAPAIVPAIGIDYKRLNLEVIPFGTAGIMVNAGFYFR